MTIKPVKTALASPEDGAAQATAQSNRKEAGMTNERTGSSYDKP